MRPGVARGVTRPAGRRPVEVGAGRLAAGGELMGEPGEQFQQPRVLPGLSDGGAHVTRRCSSHYPTYMLSYFVRELGAMTLEEVVRGFEPFRALRV